MNVGQVRHLLKQFNQDTEMGVCLSSVTGWVSGIRRIVTDEKGRVLIDQEEETLDSEEVKIIA